MLRPFILAFMLLRCFHSGESFVGDYATVIERESLCKNNARVSPMVEFNMHRFSGVWYTSYLYYKESKTLPSCHFMEILARDDETYFGVVTEKNHITNKYYSYLFNVTSAQETGKLTLEYDSPTIEDGIGETEFETYMIIHTDYDNYAINCVCYTTNGLSYESATIMTREQNVPKAKAKIYLDVATSFNVDQKKLFKVNQVGCPKQRH